jgi:predicted amidophosphoribosyltransferase
MKISAEIVKGICSTCEQDTTLVGLTPEVYRCMNCGADLQQHVNGKISYLPVIASPPDKKKMPYVKEWK